MPHFLGVPFRCFYWLPSVSVDRAAAISNNIESTRRIKRTCDLV